MKPDVIVCWPRSCDYPLWRQFIRDNRERFAKVIVAFTEHDGLDYRPFVRQAMEPDSITFLDILYLDRGEDWRDNAVNAALDESDAEWVWFTEQDFLITNSLFFWSEVEIGRHHPIAGVDAIGIQEKPGRRAHPACLFVRRSSVDATDRDFARPPEDHFGWFVRQLPVLFAIREGSYEHLQGLTQNHWLVDSGQAPVGIFNEARFKQYLRDCMEVTVPLDPGWVERGVHYLRASAA